jgi:hypothetical protein
MPRNSTVAAALCSRWMLIDHTAREPARHGPRINQSNSNVRQTEFLKATSHSPFLFSDSPVSSSFGF